MQWIEEWIEEKEVEKSVDTQNLVVQIKLGARERMAARGEYRVEGEGCSALFCFLS